MEEKQKQPRKKYAKGDERGTATQTKVTFKLDNILKTWLNSKPNKGRYLNNLIRTDMKKAWTGDDEHTWELDRLDDWEP